MIMRTVISVSLTGEMAGALAKAAKNSGSTKSAVVKEALRAYLWEERFRRLRERMMKRAEAEGLLTDEDVFRKVS